METSKFEVFKQTKPMSVTAVCSHCGGPRKLNVITRYVGEYYHDESGYQRTSTYDLCQCLGCETVHLRSAHIDNETFEHDEFVTVFPEYKQVRGEFFESQDRRAIPPRVLHVYKETRSAYDAGLMLLAGGGLRAVVEAVCQDKGMPNTNLQKKIDALVGAGYLAKQQADLLHEERYLGNAALHEIDAPDAESVRDGLEIVENLLSTIYIMPLRAKRLKDVRTRKDKKKA